MDNAILNVTLGGWNMIDSIRVEETYGIMNGFKQPHITFMNMYQIGCNRSKNN
jgi:hypothetical protein